MLSARRAEREDNMKTYELMINVCGTYFWKKEYSIRDAWRVFYKAMKKEQEISLLINSKVVVQYLPVIHKMSFINSAGKLTIAK